jgi:hypothetical protein
MITPARIWERERPRHLTEYVAPNLRNKWSELMTLHFEELQLVNLE